MQKRGGDLRILETLGALTQRNEGNNTPTNDNDEPPTTTMTGTSTKSTTWKMLRGAGLAIVVGLAGVTAVLGEDESPTCADGINSDNCYECANENAADDYWCGGDDDPANQMSCTPFQYRPMSFNNVKGLNEWCSYSDDPINDPDADIWATLAYDDTKNEAGDPTPWPYPGVRAWAAQFNNDCSQAGGNSDYWVFHACDGAGIQGGDCRGDIKYVERFGWNYEGDKEDFEYCNYDGQPTSYDDRMYCRFVHPGTNKVYEEYKAGWTGAVNDDVDTFWAAKGLPTLDIKSAATGGGHDDSPLKQTLSNFPDWAYGNEHPYTWTGKWFSFPMFAWRASWVGDDHDNKLSWPTIAENGWKVYADNESCGEDGDFCAGAPPEVDFILGGLTWEDDGTPKLVFDMWRSDKDGNMKKLNDEVAGGDPFVLYPVHENDGSCAPW